MNLETWSGPFLVILVSQILSLTNSAVLPRSPCPQVFSYNSTNTQSDRWYGEILIRADTTLSGFWIDVELDRPAQMLGNYLAEVTSTDNQEFKIQDLDRRLVRGSVTPVQIYVKFGESDSQIPKVRVIRLNGRQICPAEGEENDPEGLMEPHTEYSNNRGSSTQFTSSKTPGNSNKNTPNYNTGSVMTDYGNQGSRTSSTQSSTNRNQHKGTNFGNTPSSTQKNTHRTTQATNIFNTDQQHRPTVQTNYDARPTNTREPTRATSDRNTQNERDRNNMGGTQWNKDQNWNDNRDQGTQIRTGDLDRPVPDFRPEPARGSDSNFDRNRGSETSSVYSTSQRRDEPKRGSGSNSNRDSDTSFINSQRGQGSSTNQGTQTDVYSNRDTNRNDNGNRGTQTDIYSSSANSHRGGSDTQRGSDTHRGSNSNSGNNRDTDDTYSNRDTHSSGTNRDTQNPNRDFDTHRGGSDTQSGSNWNDDTHRGTQSSYDRGTSNKYNDRQNSQHTTTVYTSLDDAVRPIQRPSYTTERYEPITQRPTSNMRPDHTPLSNSNARPSEPSSSDYYEWGVRRTTKRGRITPPPRNNHQTSEEQCGKVAARPVALISRGSPTKTGEYPWHAAIYRPEGIDLRYICGATLISLSTLVTAAHCVTRQSNGRPVKPDSLVIYLGKHSLRRWTGNEQTATVSEIIVHPGYNHTAFQADIALMKLSTPVTYNDYVRPVCLWDSRRSSIESVVARRGTVVGWGYDEYQVVTDELMQAQMPIVTKLECIQSYPTFFSRFVTDLTYCAGFRNGTTACNGDSGGGMVFLEEPLDYNAESAWRLRGIVSIGVSITDQFVCDYNHYIVFTDVAQFLPWIEANM